MIPVANAYRFDMGPMLGAGAFGEVYLATMWLPSGIQKTVAVKVLKSGLDPGSHARERLVQEARVLSELQSPTIVSITELTTLEGRLSLVMEYVAGRDLADCVHADPRLPPRAALEVVGRVAYTLDEAYDARGPDGAALLLVHRDIKPENIRVTRQATVKVLDFGIATGVMTPRITGELEAFGTLVYMAPEVLNGTQREALPSRDVFALGCTLYECLSGGVSLFDGLETAQMIGLAGQRAAFEELLDERLRALSGIGSDVVALLRTMLAYDHRLRPTPLRVADVCHHLVDRMEGDRLYAWCRFQDWGAVSTKRGVLSDQTLYSDVTTITEDALQEAEAPAVEPPATVLPQAPPEPAPAPPDVPSEATLGPAPEARPFWREPVVWAAAGALVLMALALVLFVVAWGLALQDADVALTPAPEDTSPAAGLVEPAASSVEDPVWVAWQAPLGSGDAPWMPGVACDLLEAMAPRPFVGTEGGLACLAGSSNAPLTSGSGEDAACVPGALCVSLDARFAAALDLGLPAPCGWEARCGQDDVPWTTPAPREVVEPSVGETPPDPGSARPVDAPPGPGTEQAQGQPEPAPRRPAPSRSPASSTPEEPAIEVPARVEANRVAVRLLSGGACAAIEVKSGSQTFRVSGEGSDLLVPPGRISVFAQVQDGPQRRVVSTKANGGDRIQIACSCETGTCEAR